MEGRKSLASVRGKEQLGSKISECKFFIEDSYLAKFY